MCIGVEYLRTQRRDRHQFLSQLFLKGVTTSVMSTQLNEYLLAFSPLCCMAEQLHLQNRSSSPCKDQIACTYTLYLTLARRSADVQCTSRVLRTMFTANVNKLGSYTKCVLETRVPPKKPVEESRLLSSREPFISSAGAFACSLDELCWQVTYDPWAMAHCCLMQSCRHFKMISCTQVLYINKIHNLNPDKHTKMHWIRRKCKI